MSMEQAIQEVSLEEAKDNGLYLVAGSKGGVGKSMVTMALVDLLREQGQNVFLVECDNSNPDVWKAHKDEIRCELVNLDEAEGWIRFLSLAQLRDLESNASADRASVVRTRHGRVVSLIMSLLLLLLGLPFFLDRSPANIVRDATKCLAVCGLCYISTFIAQSIRLESVSAFAAWMPIFVFGTLAMVLFDRVKT